MMRIKDMKEKVFITNSVVKTKRIAGKVAKILKPGDNLLLIGELGAGKTTFIQYMADYLGVKEVVNSPSFKLLNEYSAKDFKIYHFDLYRLDSIEDIEALGFEEYIHSNGICVVEWADKAKELWPVNRYEIYIDYIDHTERKISICTR